MKRLLRWAIDFLERKFPDKVVVTAAKYNALAEMQTAQAEKIAELTGRIGQLETGIRTISMQMGFAGKIPGEFSLER